jgi:hypothetical protein
MVDLNTLIDPLSGWELSDAADINSAGQITGQGLINHEYHAYLLTPIPLLGDFNGDGVVNAADYVVWRKTDGTTSGYNAWRTHFGQTAGSGSSAVAGATVPEPKTLLLILMAIAAGWSRYRSRAEWRAHVSAAALLVSILGLLALEGRAAASTLYTIENNNRRLYKIDTTTFATTLVASNMPFYYGDLAWDSSSRTMYMVDGHGGHSLYKIDIITGATTLIGDHNIEDMFGLAYDTATAKLYGASFTGTGQFYQLDTATGAATPTGSGIGDRIGALAYNSTADQLVALNDCLDCAKLYSVNPATGAGTLLKSTGLDTNNSGMTYDPTLNRYWDLDVNGRLSYFDPANGYNQTQVATLEQFPGFPGSFDGLAFVNSIPEPASAVLLLMMAAAGACMRSHRKLRVSKLMGA